MTHKITWTTMMGMLALALALSAPVPVDAAGNRPGISKKAKSMKHRPDNVHKTAPHKSGGNLNRPDFGTGGHLGAVPHKSAKKPFASPEGPYLKPGGNQANGSKWTDLNESDPGVTSSASASGAGKKGAAVYVEEISSGSRPGKAIVAPELDAGVKARRQKGVEAGMAGQVDLGRVVSK